MATVFQAGEGPRRACVSCGAALWGEYCSQCGERVVTADDLRVRRFVADAVHGAFDLDSRLWRSVRMLLLRPGELTAEHMRGRRRPYLGPLQLFLLGNLLFFTMISTIGGVETFTTKLRYHVEMIGYGGVASRLVEQRAPAGTEARAEYEQRFNEATPRYANTMVILMVPLFAAILFLLYRGGRGYVHHLVFSLHFHAWLLLMFVGFALALRAFFMVMVMISRPAAIAAERFLDNELTFSLLVIGFIVAYLVPALRRSYGDRTAPALLRAILLVPGLMVALTIYRMLLFFIVYVRVD